MADVELAKIAAEAAVKLTADTKLKSLEMLFDYTKMHIGLYLTLTTAYIAVASLKVKDEKFLFQLPSLLVCLIRRFGVAYSLSIWKDIGVERSKCQRDCYLSSQLCCHPIDFGGRR